VWTAGASGGGPLPDSQLYAREMKENKLSRLTDQDDDAVPQSQVHDGVDDGIRQSEAGLRTSARDVTGGRAVLTRAARYCAVVDTTITISIACLSATPAGRGIGGLLGPAAAGPPLRPL
jgi:hypothetical protein